MDVGKVTFAVATEINCVGVSGGWPLSVGIEINWVGVLWRIWLQIFLVSSKVNSVELWHNYNTTLVSSDENGMYSTIQKNELIPGDKNLEKKECNTKIGKIVAILDWK